MNLRSVPTPSRTRPGPKPILHRTFRIATGRGLTPRRRLVRVGLILLGLGLVAGLGIPALIRKTRPAPTVPPFERLVGRGLGRIVDFRLADTGGRIVTGDAWRDRPAVVLFFLGVECPVSNGFAPEMARLAGRFGAKGVAFFGIHTDPDVTAESAAAHAAEYRLPFPILLDPAQDVAGQAEIRVTPEAAVFLADGTLVYRGRIDDRVAADGKHRDAPGHRDLEAALEAILADELPVVLETTAFGCPLPPAAAPAAEAITFTKHIAPILNRHCVACHREGEVGPFPLATYRDAAKRAEFLRDVVDSGRMPPWKPRPGAGVFLDAQRLTERERRTLAAWAESGAAEGDPADLPPPPEFPDGWRLGKPDLVLTMPEPYTVAADGKDVYRGFAIPIPQDTDREVRGLEFRPGNRKVVHHSRFYVDSGDDCRKLDDADPTPGFRTVLTREGDDVPKPSLGGWTPGTTPRFTPEGAGRPITRGSTFVLVNHYHPSGKPETDASSIGVYFRDTPATRTVAGLTLSTPKIDIPPGEPDHYLFLEATVKADIHAYSASPHAHYLLRELRLMATLPDGTEQPLLWIDDWDLDWQDQYRFAKPVRLPKGTRLTMSGRFDNSSANPRNPHDPPRRVRYGLGTNDEMFACHLEIIPDRPEGYKVYKRRPPLGL